MLSKYAKIFAPALIGVTAGMIGQKDYAARRRLELNAEKYRNRFVELIDTSVKHSGFFDCYNTTSSVLTRKIPDIATNDEWGVWIIPEMQHNSALDHVTYIAREMEYNTGKFPPKSLRRFKFLVLDAGDAKKSNGYDYMMHWLTGELRMDGVTNAKDLSARIKRNLTDVEGTQKILIIVIKNLGAESYNWDETKAFIATCAAESRRDRAFKVICITKHMDTPKILGQIEGVQII